MTSYYTIMSSLPRHDRKFNVEQVPVSRIQLERRISFLPEEKRNLLYMLETVVWVSWFDQTLSFPEILRITNRLLKRHDSFIDEIIHWYFDIRSLLSALRIRRDRQSPPDKYQDYWCTRWSMRLLDNWNEPDFGLKEVYPWLSGVNARLLNGEPDILEKTVLTQLWKRLERIENRHYFDFQAIIIYLLRWDIVNYWSQFNKEAAIKRFINNAHHIIIKNAIANEVAGSIMSSIDDVKGSNS